MKKGLKKRVSAESGNAVSTPDRGSNTNDEQDHYLTAPRELPDGTQEVTEEAVDCRGSENSQETAKNSPVIRKRSTENPQGSRDTRNKTARKSRFAPAIKSKSTSDIAQKSSGVQKVVPSKRLISGDGNGDKSHAKKAKVTSPSSEILNQSKGSNDERQVVQSRQGSRDPPQDQVKLVLRPSTEKLKGIFY